VWSTPDKNDPKQQAETLHAGHFFVDPAGPAKQVAMRPMGALFQAFPLRWKEGLR
jgi:hypothetical protein